MARLMNGWLLTMGKSKYMTLLGRTSRMKLLNEKEKEVLNSLLQITVSWKTPLVIFLMISGQKYDFIPKVLDSSQFRENSYKADSFTIPNQKENIQFSFGLI